MSMNVLDALIESTIRSFNFDYLTSRIVIVLCSPWESREIEVVVENVKDFYISDFRAYNIIEFLDVWDAAKTVESSDDVKELIFHFIFERARGSDEKFTELVNEIYQQIVRGEVQLICITSVYGVSLMVLAKGCQLHYL